MRRVSVGRAGPGRGGAGEGGPRLSDGWNAVLPEIQRESSSLGREWNTPGAEGRGEIRWWETLLRGEKVRVRRARGNNSQWGVEGGGRGVKEWNVS